VRPPKDETWLVVARAIAEQSTCLRRRVGCVLTNRRGHVLATGWNGVASGQPHCNERAPYDDNEAAYDAVHGGFNHQYPNACVGATAPSGTALDQCQAIHAEQNALLQCRDAYAIETCYCTASPCVTCVKLLLNTSCRRIVFIEEYPHHEAEDLWLSGEARFRREWRQIKITE
jgi:dCMP deaminase